MQRLRGAGLGTGSAIGAAAVVRLQRGIPVAPPAPAGLVERLEAGTVSERPDIVLAAPDLSLALAVLDGLRWAAVVGIVTSAPLTEGYPLRIPVVTALGEGVDQLVDGDLVLLDAQSGLFVVDPDANAISAHQSTRLRLSPRRRIFLGEAHLPAHTTDGRPITVAGPATSIDDATSASEAGFDLLFVPSDSPLYASLCSSHEAVHVFPALFGAAGGKPVMVQGGYGLDPEPLLHAASQADVTVLLSHRPDLPLGGIGEQMAMWEDVLTEMVLDGRQAAMPRISADLSGWRPSEETELATTLDAAGSHGLSTVVTTLETGFTPDADLVSLAALVGEANARMMAVTCYLAGSGALDARLAEFAVAIGCNGIVTQDAVAAKSLVAELSFSEAQEAALQYLANAGASE